MFKVTAEDPDINENGRIIYAFTPYTQNAFGHLFRIEEESGDVIVAGALDFETQRVYQLSVSAMDQGPNAFPAYCNVIVTLRDVNDEAPVITISTLTESGRAEVVENADAGFFVGHVAVSDGDQGEAGSVTCHIDTGSDDFELQVLSPLQYKIVTRRAFNYELRAQYVVTMTCVDGGALPMSSSRTLDVFVLDANDHAPLFSARQYFGSIEEGAGSKRLTTAKATDNDEGQNAEVTYSIEAVDSRFEDLVRIDSVTGVVRSTGAFDFEAASSVDYVITATDHGDPPETATATLTVNVIDVNDESPQFELAQYNFEVRENLAAGALVGHVRANDAEAFPFGDVSYYVDAGSTGTENFDVVTLSDGRGKVVTSAALDREERSSYTIWIVAHNEGYFNTESRVKVKAKITDDNDNDPQIHFLSSSDNVITISRELLPGDVITRINATDADDVSTSNARLAYTMTSTFNFAAIDNVTGVVVATRALDSLEERDYVFRVVVTDFGSPQRLAATEMTLSVTSDAASASALGVILGVVLTVVFLFIATIIIVFCVCRRRRKQEERTHKYNCRLEANKTLMSSPMHAPNHSLSRETNHTHLANPDYTTLDASDDVTFAHACIKEASVRSLKSNNHTQEAPAVDTCSKVS